MKRVVRLALIQDGALGYQDVQGPAKVLDATIAKIRHVAADGAQIICLKEMFASPYFCTSEDDRLFDLAETSSGQSISAIQQVAKECKTVVVVPFFEKRAPGVYHNSAAVIDADGTHLGIYRKMHIPDDPLYYEKYYFTPGDVEEPHGGYRIFETAYAKIGVLICWDQWYPEAARITSMLGAEILFYPTAIGWHPSEKEQVGEEQWQAWHTIQRSHAVANGVFVAAVNRIGHELTPGTDGIEFYGRSFVAAPFGKVLAQAETGVEQNLLVDCDLSLIEARRRHWPFFRDRRIDSYAPILKRFLV